MRRFVFKLEGLLEQRKQVEIRCQRGLAEAHKMVLHIERELTQAAAAEKEASVPLRGRLDPRALATHVRFSQIMRQKLSTLRQHLDAARQELATAQAALVEAGKQRKVLEKLEEKQQAQLAAEQEKREAHAQEDVTQQMTHRSNDSANDSAESFPPCSP